MNNNRALSEQQSRKISFFMLIFILVVVLFHSEFRYYYPIIEDLTAVSTSYFFSVSAFFFYRELKFKTFEICLKKRVITLLIPYLLWNIIYMIFYLGIYNYTVPSIISGFTVSPFCVPSWYLMTLFIFLLLTPIIKRAFEYKYTTAIILIMGVAISYLGYIKFQEELAMVSFIGPYLVRMTEYLTSYLVGGVIGTYFSVNTSVKRNGFIFGIISSCMILYLIQCEIPVGLRWILWVLFPLALWESVPEDVFKSLGFLRYFTEPAFFMNMSHCYLLFISGIIMSKINFVGGKYLAAAKVIIALLVAYILYYLFKLLIPNMLSYLMGKRTGRK